MQTYENFRETFEKTAISIRECPLTTGGGTKNLGKNDLTYLVIPLIKRKWNSAIPPPFRRGVIW